MKGIMKKIISALLVLIMLVSLVPTTVFAADDPSYTSFQADVYSELFEKNHMNDGTSYGRTYYNMLENDMGFKVDIIAWETLSAIASPSNLGEVITKQDYYKTVLFDLVVNKNEDTYDEKVEDIGQYLLGEVKNSTNKFMVSTAKDILKTEDGASANELKSMPLTESKKLLIAGEVASTAADVMQLLEWCDNVADAIQVTANYLALRQVEEGTKEVLTYIANDSQNCFDLRYAASTMIECIGEGSQSVVNSMKQGALSLFTDTFGAFVNAVWKNVLLKIANGYGAVLLIGVKGARAVIDFLMSNEDKSRAYYQLQANVICEDALKSAVNGLKQRYLNDPSEKNAIGYMKAVAMYEDVVLLGFDYSVDLLTVVVNSNWNKLFGVYNRGFETINDIKNLKAQKAGRYKDLEDAVFNAYINTYIPDYNEIYEDLDNQWNLVAVRKVELVVNSYTAFLNHRLIIPANTYPSYANVGTDVSYSSSNTNVIKVGSDASVTPVGPGTADIIATSGNGVQDRCRITVVPYTAAENSTGYTIVGYEGDDNTLVIPGFVNGTDITEIDSYAFCESNTLNTISIPESVTSIGEYAFAGCANLTNVVLPSGISTIAPCTFASCKSLKSVNLPSGIESIGEHAFDQCHNLSDIEIPQNVKSIGQYAFYQCNNIQSVTLSDKLTSIGEAAFFDCDKLTNVTIPKNVSSIGKYVFNHADGLNSINVNSGNGYYYSVDGVLFEKASAKLLQYPANKAGSVYDIPKGTKAVEKEAFYACNKLVEVSSPSSVSELVAGTFIECDNLTRLYMYENTTYNNLTSYPERSDFEFFGYNISSNEAAVFYYSSENTTVVIPNVIGGYPVTTIKESEDLFYNNLNIAKVVLPDNLKTIEEFAFFKCTNLKEISFGNGLKTIEHGAFRYCESLKEIVLPDSVIDIGEMAFDLCEGVERIELSSNLETIGEEAFHCCESLTEITIPGSVKTIGMNAFGGCAKLAEVNFMSGVEKLESHMFMNCDSLTSVTFPDTVNYIGELAFVNCDNIENVYVDDNSSYYYDVDGVLFKTDTRELLYYPIKKTANDYVIPAGTKAIGTDAFEGNTTLNSISIPSSVKSIGESAFDGCTSLNELYLEPGLEHIGRFAFRSCIGLKELNLPDTVTTLDAGAFTRCVGIKSIILPESITSLTYDVFSYCQNLDYVLIPESVTSIDIDAFDSSFPVIYGYTGSEAEIFADENNLIFRDILTHNPDEDFVETEQTEKTFAFINTEGWNNVYLYTWYTDENGSAVNTGAWPGNKMEYAGTTPMGDIYTITVPKEMTYIIFNNGEGVQTKDYKISSFGNDRVFKLSDEYGSLRSIESVDLSFSGASLTLHDNLSVGYKVDQSMFKSGLYTNPYVVFKIGDTESVVTDYSIENGKLVFDFNNISPQQTNETIYATLYADFNGTSCASETKEYSVATYCYNMLDKYTSSEYAELQTLLVDLLNYGAMSQIYTSYKTNDLVNANLTDAQKAWGTSVAPTYETVQNVAYKTIDNPTVTWKGGGLNLVDAVTMRFKITADSGSYENLVIKAETDDRIWTIPYEEFSETTGGCYVYFSGLNAGEMSEPVYLTVYENGEAVSNTLSYSIESYAYSKQNSTDTNLTNLLEAMMKYGNSAYAYAN